MAESNPYLAHLNQSSTFKGKSYLNGSSSNGSSSGALDGLQPRKVNGAQCFKAMVGSNSFVHTSRHDRLTRRTRRRTM